MNLKSKVNDTEGERVHVSFCRVSGVHYIGGGETSQHTVRWTKKIEVHCILRK